MKKLLFFLLLSCLTFGQNIDFLKKANDSDSLYTRELAEKIFEGYKILPERNSDKESRKRFGSYKIIYTLKKNATEKEVTDYIEGNGCKDCVNVEFKILTKNANPHLKIKGDKYYVFQEARGDFLNMFPFWKRDVEPKATTDKTYDKYPLYNYKNIQDKIWLVFRPTDSYWIIRNMSDQSQP